MSFPWIEKSKSIDMLINMKSNPKNIHHSIYEEVEKNHACCGEVGLENNISGRNIKRETEEHLTSREHLMKVGR